MFFNAKIKCHQYKCLVIPLSERQLDLFFIAEGDNHGYYPCTGSTNIPGTSDRDTEQ